MKKIFTHLIAIIAGLIAGYFLFNLDTNHALEKVQSRNDRVSMLTRLGDINKLKEEGFKEAAKLFEPSLFLQLGDVGNYYKDKNQAPTELEWIMIDPVIEYLRNNERPAQFRNYVEASKGVKYLMDQKKNQE